MHADSIQHDRGEHYYCCATAARWQTEGHRGTAPREGTYGEGTTGVEDIQFNLLIHFAMFISLFPSLSLGVQDECTTILKTISHHINTEHNELQSHRLLSIFKMSEVDVVWPESTSAARSGHGHGQQTVANSLLTLLLIALVHCWRRAASPITT